MQRFFSRSHFFKYAQSAERIAEGAVFVAGGIGQDFFDPVVHGAASVSNSGWQ